MSALRIEQVIQNSDKIIDFTARNAVAGSVVSKVIKGGGVATNIIKFPTATATGATITALEGEIAVPVLADTVTKTAGGYALQGLKILGKAGLIAVASGVGAVTGLHISEKFKEENPELADKLAWKTADQWLSEKLGFDYNQSNVPVIIDPTTNATYVPEDVIKPMVNMFYNENLYNKIGTPVTPIVQGTVLTANNVTTDLDSVFENIPERYKDAVFPLINEMKQYINDKPLGENTFPYVVIQASYFTSNVGIMSSGFRSTGTIFYLSDPTDITDLDFYNIGYDDGISSSPVYFKFTPERYASKIFMYQKIRQDGKVDVGNTTFQTNGIINTNNGLPSDRGDKFIIDNYSDLAKPIVGAEQVGRLPQIQVPSTYDVFADYGWINPITHAGTKWYPLVIGQTATQENAQNGLIPDTNPDILNDALTDAEVEINGLIDPVKPPTPIPDVVVPPVPFNPTDTINNGFVGCYNLTPNEVKQFSEFLWSEGFLNTLKHLISDPIQTIISFHQIYATPQIETEKTPIKCGFVVSTVNSNRVTNQYITIDCGTIDLSEFFNSYSDYEPYTKTELFLPFIGIVRLNTNEIMGRSVKIEYKVDVFTGTCVANIYVNGALLYTYNGNCAVQLPITGGSFAESVIGIIGGAIGGASKGGFGGALIGGATNTLNMLEVQRTGNLSANAGVFCPRKPYFIITRTNDVTPTNYQVFEGYASSDYVSLANLSGFTKVIGVQINSISCTEQERDMLLTILNDGVIF